MRQPISTAPPAEETQDAGLPPPPQFPEALPPVALDRLEIARIVIGEPVIGQAVTLSLSGYARVAESNDMLDLALSIERL